MCPVCLNSTIQPFPTTEELTNPVVQNPINKKHTYMALYGSNIKFIVINGSICIESKK
jgi:hypothetical protein